MNSRSDLIRVAILVPYLLWTAIRDLVRAEAGYQTRVVGFTTLIMLELLPLRRDTRGDHQLLLKHSFVLN